MALIEKHGHGGDIWTAAESFGGKPDQFLDFSANINPLGPPKALIPLLTEALPEITRYPDPVCRRLRQKLGSTYSLPEEFFLIGNGAAECIQLAVSALQPKRVGLLYPCFSEYEAAAKKAGCDIVPFFTCKSDQFLPQTEHLLAFLPQIDFLFIGHPNNPTGNHLRLEDLRAVAEACREAGVTLGVDEAFLDFLPHGEEESLLPEIERFPNLILFRSMTKMFAIPGLRLGFVIAHPKLVARMASLQIPWSVNHLAQKAGEWLVDEKEFVLATQSFVQQEREILIQHLQGIPGLTIFPSRTNYLLLHTAGCPVEDLQRELAQQGILIRNCTMYPGLGEGYFRIAVRSRQENERMWTALAACSRKKAGSS